MIEVGRIQSIWRYPVKSMRGETLDACDVYWYGIEGDRRYAFVRGDVSSSFPWLTARQVPRLLSYVPRLRDAAHPLESPVDVITPGGDVVPVESLGEQMQCEYSGPVHLLQLRRGAYDAMAISMVSTTTAARLSGTSDARRYRANFVIELNDQVAFGEDRWIGSTLQIGDRADAVRLRVLRATKRCKMVCVDPDTIAFDAAQLQRCAEQHDANAGIYAVPESVGYVRAGEHLFIT
jgi:uncharacterized protein YcbX